MSMDSLLYMHVRYFCIQFKSITIPQVGLIFMTGPGVYALLAPVAGFIADRVRRK